MEAAGVAAQAVAHQRERVRERQEARDPRQPERHRGDREERAREEPGRDRNRRNAGDVLLLARDPARERLGGAVHGDGQEHRRAEEPEQARAVHGEVDLPRDCEPDQRRDLEAGDRERDDEVAEHEQRARHRRRQQLALGAALAVDDHAEAEEERVQRHQQADRADRDVRLVACRGVQRGFQRRRDHECEQHRRQQRHDELARRARGQREAAACERAQRVCAGGPHNARRGESCGVGNAGHVIDSFVRN